MYHQENLKPKINQIIQQNLSNPDLKGEFIANELNINRMNLHRKLKKYYDMNARDYIQHVRIQTAKQRLKKSSKPVKVIAKNLGYEDISYFSKVFKKVNGCSPLEYRNKNK